MERAHRSGTSLCAGEHERRGAERAEPAVPTSKEELDEKYGDWTNERLEEEAAFHAQIAQYLSEIVAHFEWRTGLDPADAKDGKAIEKESERLFGAEPTLYVPSEPA